MGPKKPPSFKQLPDQPYSIQDRTGTAIPSVTRLLDRKSLQAAATPVQKLSDAKTTLWPTSSPRTPDELVKALGSDWKQHTPTLEELRHQCQQTGSVCAIFLTTTQAGIFQSKLIWGDDSWMTQGLKSVALRTDASQPKINPWLLGLHESHPFKTKTFEKSGKPIGFALIIPKAS